MSCEAPRLHSARFRKAKERIRFGLYSKEGFDKFRRERYFFTKNICY